MTLRVLSGTVTTLWRDTMKKIPTTESSATTVYIIYVLWTNSLLHRIERKIVLVKHVKGMSVYRCIIKTKVQCTQ